MITSRGAFPSDLFVDLIRQVKKKCNLGLINIIKPSWDKYYQYISKCVWFLFQRSLWSWTRGAWRIMPHVTLLQTRPASSLRKGNGTQRTTAAGSFWRVTCCSTSRTEKAESRLASSSWKAVRWSSACLNPKSSPLPLNSTVSKRRSTR